MSTEIIFNKPLVVSHIEMTHRKARADKLICITNLIPSLKNEILKLLEDETPNKEEAHINHEAIRSVINFLRILADYTWSVCRSLEDQSINLEERKKIIEDIKTLKTWYS